MIVLTKRRQDGAKGSLSLDLPEHRAHPPDRFPQSAYSPADLRKQTQVSSVQRQPRREEARGVPVNLHALPSPGPRLPPRGEADSTALVALSKSSSQQNGPPPRTRWKPIASAALFRLNFLRSCRLHPVQANKGLL